MISILFNFLIVSSNDALISKWMIFFNYRSDLTQTVAETDFTRQNRDENSLIDENLPSNGTDINAISDGRKRSVIVIKHATKGFNEKYYKRSVKV